MDMFEFNKFAGALLGSLLFVVVMHHAIDGLLEPHVPEETAYRVEVETDDSQVAQEASEEVEQPSLAAMLASADPDDGAKVFRKCGACHSIEQGGPNKVGPNLYGILGASKAHLGDFAYSDALKEMGGEWTYEDMAAFLTDPKDFVPGTKMSFAGLRKPEDIADIIAFLRTMSDSPPPLPAE